MVAGCGLAVERHETNADLHARYFAGRNDGLRPYSFERFITASVPHVNAGEANNPVVGSATEGLRPNVR